MPLTTEGFETAEYLVQAWDGGIVESYFELIDATAGSGVTSIQLLPGLGVLDPDKFDIPSFGNLNEVANYPDTALITLTESYTSNHNRKWGVQLTQNLRDFVSGQVSTPITQNQEARNYFVPQCFVSYKREDRDFTERLASILRRVFGYSSVWYDKETKVGQQWWDTILNQINRSDTFLYLLTREAVASVYCRAEFTEALRSGNHIIPIRYRSHSYPEAITRYQLHDVDTLLQNVDSLVEILAAILDSDVNAEIIEPDSLWSKRIVQPVDDRGIRFNIKVPAAVEPDGARYRLCNTGVLLVEGDRIQIKTRGKISVDGGNHWSQPNGAMFWQGQDVRNILPGTYTTAGLSEGENKGIVGSLFGWIGEKYDSIENAFYVGEEHKSTIHRDSQGFLHLAVNDVIGAYEDNVEEFDVDIEIRNP